MNSVIPDCIALTMDWQWITCICSVPILATMAICIVLKMDFKKQIEEMKFVFVDTLGCSCEAYFKYFFNN